MPHTFPHRRKRQLQWPRILGLAFMIVGMVLISLFRGDTVTQADPTPPAPPTLPASPLPPPPQELPPVNGSLNAFNPAAARTDMATQAPNEQLAANTHAAAQAPDNHTLSFYGTSQTPDSHALSINGGPGPQSQAVDAAAVIIDVGNPIPDANASSAAPGVATAAAATTAAAAVHGATATDDGISARTDGVVGVGPGRR